MAREAQLSAWLMKARGDDVQITRVENLCGAGFPDVDGYAGGAFQIELKSTKRPARGSTPLRFALRGREAQIEYLRKRWSLGGAAFFLLQVGSGADRVLYLAPGDLGDRLREGLTESELALECAPWGVFKRTTPAEVIKRVVECRSNPYRKLSRHPAACA